jgi:hypothetical protein
MSKNAVAERVEQSPIETEATTIIQIIEKAVTNPMFNVENMERLLLMQERILDRQAKASYTQAMVTMKPLLPVIGRKGKIEIRDKIDKTKINQSTPYALWEDIDEAITPILSESGFALTFRSGVSQDGKITVTGVLSHRDGHSEETTITLPHDSTGSKNAVQAVGSSTSYGKRYTATLLLNLRTKGEDDDGKAAAGPSKVTEEEAKALEDKIKLVGANQGKFLEFFGIEALADLPSSRYEEADAMLQKKAGKKK